MRGVKISIARSIQKIRAEFTLWSSPVVIKTDCYPFLWRVIRLATKSEQKNWRFINLKRREMKKNEKSLQLWAKVRSNWEERNRIYVDGLAE